MDQYVPRKRRRPALACETCRKRKVKCDRETPTCGPCSRSKTTECSYTKEPSAFVRNRDRHASSSRHATSSKSSPTRKITPGTPSADQSAPQTGHAEQSPGDRSALTPTSSYEGSHNGTTNGLRQGPTTQDLLDRINVLEQKLASRVHSLSSREHHQHADGTLNASPGPKGNMSKNRVFGQSHWMNSIEGPPFKDVMDFKYEIGLRKPTDSLVDSANDAGRREILEMARKIDECKVLSRNAKAARPSVPFVPPDYRSFVPAREISDQLLGLYLRTFETVFRILHVPTFEAEYSSYWQAPESASVAFNMKLLAVLAIGACFYQGPDEISLRELSVRWVRTASMWISAPMEKARMNISGLQVYCLVLLARQTSSVGGDLVWISAGSLVRVAMLMGLHRDPTNFPKLSVFTGELRRRLWSTILELLVQSSLDSGMPPLISCYDFDCEGPANINDYEITEDCTVRPISKPRGTMTQSTIQVLLRDSFPLRLSVAKTLNDFRSDANYDEILRLDGEMNTANRLSTNVLRQAAAAGSERSPSDFQRKYFELLTQRFILSLHRSPAAESLTNTKFYYSRKVYYETGLRLIAPCRLALRPDPAMLVDDYSRFLEISSGLYRGVLVSATGAVCFELLLQLQEDYVPGCPITLDFGRRELYEALKILVRFTQWRVRQVETNIKCALYITCLLGQADAMIAGTSQQDGITAAAKASVDVCHQILKERMDEISSRASSVAGTSPMQYDVDSLDWDVMMQQDLGFDFSAPDSWLMSGWGSNEKLSSVQ